MDSSLLALKVARLVWARQAYGTSVADCIVPLAYSVPRRAHSCTVRTTAVVYAGCIKAV